MLSISFSMRPMPGPPKKSSIGEQEEVLWLGKNSVKSTPNTDVLCSNFRC